MVVPFSCRWITLLLAIGYVLSVTLRPAWIDEISRRAAALAARFRKPHAASPVREPFVGQYDRTHTPEDGDQVEAGLREPAWQSAETGRQV